MYLVLRPRENLLGQRGVDMVYEALATDDPFRAKSLLEDGCQVYVLQLPKVEEIENTVTTIEKLHVENE